MFHVKAVDRRLALRYMNGCSLVLDVGGGQATDAGIFAVVARNVVLVEINERLLLAGSRFVRREIIREKVDFVLGSATALPLRSSLFDIVTCFSVLDHLPTKESVIVAIGEFARVVRASGHVTVTFPNKAFLPGTVSMLARRVFDRDSSLERRFTPREMCRFLVSNGLVPNMYDFGTAAYVGPGIKRHNIAGPIRSLPPQVFNWLSWLVIQITNWILSWPCMHVLGPRFGVLCSPRKKRVESRPEIS